MKKIISVAASAALFAMSSAAFFSAPATAAPNMSRQQQYVVNWCKSHPRDNDCRDFDRNHHNWSSSRYQGWYRSHQHDRGFDPLAAGIFGFAAGAIGAAIVNSQQPHMTPHQIACTKRYGSAYNPRTDTYKLPGRAARACNI